MMVLFTDYDQQDDIVIEEEESKEPDSKLEE